MALNPRTPRRQSTQPAPSEDNFNTADYLNVSDYNADIDDIRKRLDALESRVKDKPSLANSFNEAFEGDRNMDATLSKVIVNHVLKDDTVKSAIKDMVNKIDRDYFKAFMKRFGWAIGAIILALISGLAGYLIPR